MGAEDQIHKGVALPQFLRHMLLLDHAPAKTDDQPRMAALEIFQRPHVAEHPVLRMLPHRAGVKKDQIRLLRPLGEAEAHGTQHSLDPFGIGDILLAAEGAHTAKRRFPGKPRFVPIAHPDAVFPLEVKLLRRNGSDMGHETPVPSCR